MSEETNKDTRATRQDILGLIDRFIDQIQQIRKILLGMSLSAIILAPLAIALSVYLLFHPRFFAILEIENEFGLILSVLLGAVIIISGIWFFTGIREYRAMSYWKGSYNNFMKDKAELDQKIASQFGLDHEQ